MEKSIFPEWLAWIPGAFEYLVDTHMHPAVTALVFMVLLISRVKFEEPWIRDAKDAVLEAAKSSPADGAAILARKHISEKKADSIANYAWGIAMLVSIAGQFTLYWPSSGQGRALCALFSVMHIGLAGVAMFFVNKTGMIERVGLYLQRKADEKMGATDAVK